MTLVDLTDFWDEMARPAPHCVVVRGTEVGAGSRVILRPRRGGDILDLALAGRAALVEEVVQEPDGRCLLAVTLEEDPGRDLGRAGLPGHRFFFTVDEVEPALVAQAPAAVRSGTDPTSGDPAAAAATAHLMEPPLSQDPTTNPAADLAANPAANPAIDPATDSASGSGVRRVLVAGIGNIFLGDDGFGVEVARRLAVRALPAGAEVRDFGTRGLDLAYALQSGYDAAILVDASPRAGAPPGTLFLLEPEPPPELAEAADPVPLNAHGMDPVRVLRLARSMGRLPPRLRIVGCQPGTSPRAEDYEDVLVQLSPPVREAVDEAVHLVETILKEWLLP